MRTLTALLFAIALTISGAVAQELAAPLGLKWGVSSDTIRQMGVALTKVELADFGVTFSATNLPKTLSDVQFVYLSFGHDDKLWRIAIVSRTFERDGFGSTVLARYDDLKATLSKRYGPPKDFERLSDDDYFRTPDNFVYGIYRNENTWGSTFDTKVMGIELSIGASGTSDSYWRLVYKSEAGEEAFKLAHNTDEAGSL